MTDVTAILENPERYGLEWNTREIGRGGAKGSPSYVSMGNVPLVRVIAITPFEAEFPGLILAAVNGQSVIVKVQAVARRMKEHNPRTSDDELKRAQVDALKGIRSPSTPRTIILPSGTDDDTMKAFAALNPGVNIVRSGRKGPGDSDAAKVLGTELRTDEFKQH